MVGVGWLAGLETRKRRIGSTVGKGLEPLELKTHRHRPSQLGTRTLGLPLLLPRRIAVSPVLLQSRALRMHCTDWSSFENISARLFCRNSNVGASKGGVEPAPRRYRVRIALLSPLRVIR